jgi:hypothetical protein
MPNLSLMLLKGNKVEKMVNTAATMGSGPQVDMLYYSSQVLTMLMQQLVITRQSMVLVKHQMTH